jgi:hypothetical protein
VPLNDSLTSFRLVAVATFTLRNASKRRMIVRTTARIDSKTGDPSGRQRKFGSELINRE